MRTQNPMSPIVDEIGSFETLREGSYNSGMIFKSLGREENHTPNPNQLPCAALSR